MSEVWSDWIEHDNAGWPGDVDPHETVIAQMAADGYVLSPVKALSINWKHEDAVARYKRRVSPGMQILERIAADPQPVKESA